MAVAIITDSAADMSSAQAREYGVEVVPLWVIFGDERLRDGVDITRATFYERLATAKVLPHSEPLDAAGFEAVFKRHVDAGDECVVPIVSAKLSKTYENAKAAAAKFDRKVHVIDTETLSGGQFLLAQVAGEMARAGAGALDIIAALERGKETQHGYQVMPDLTYLGRSGRLNKAIVTLGTMLKVNPILQVKDGSIETAGQTRTYEKAQELIIDIASRHIDDVTKTRFAVGHVQAPELAEQMASALRTKLNFPPKSFVIYEVGPTVAVNVGPGAIAIFSIAGV
ncbi:MAG TPA: DegV family protein [Candidatus Baltobacteraceae bacterium]|nr:DegV family protein [Candidatus Baltobacteraceae bacterium]